MAKRVYTETVKKWLIGAGITVGTLIGGLFLYLIFLGAIDITGYSGDVVCAGTEEDPCYAYINLTAKEDIFIYPIGYDPWGRDTIIEFNPAVKSWKLQRSWGSGWRDIPLNKTCTGKWCGAPDNRGVSYSYVFREGKKYQLRIVGYKNSPYEDVKWSIDYENKEYLDPIWKGIEKKKSQNSVLATIPKNESIRVTDQSGFDENFDWNFKKINENQWLATFKIKVPIYENIKECEEIQSEEDKFSCAKQKAKEIFGKEKEEEYGKAISKLSEYPKQELTDNIKVSNIKFDKETGEGNYILDFPEGFGDGEIIKIGANSTTIVTSTTDPTIGWTSSNRFQYSCRGDNSRIHVIFQYPAETVYYTYSDDNGYNWNNPVNFSGAVDLYDMNLDCYDENITIAYTDTDGTDEMWVNFSTDNGATWSGMPVVSDSIAMGARCLQRGGDLVCVYGENTNDEYNLCYSKNKTGWESCHSIFDTVASQTFLSEIIYYPDEWWHADSDGIIVHLRYGGGDNMHIHQGNYTNTNYTHLSDTAGGDSWTIVGDPDRPGVFYVSEDDDGSTDAWFYYSMDNGTTITGEGKVADDCQYAWGQIRDEVGSTRANVEIFCAGFFPTTDIYSYTYDGETTITGPVLRYDGTAVESATVTSNVDGRNSNDFVDLLLVDFIDPNYNVIFLNWHYNDSIVPEFYDYWDDSYNLTTSGIGNFNVTVNNTNGTVFLYVNNTAILATNLTEKIYNASYNFTASGTYSHYWYSWGTGPNNNYDTSDTRDYVVNPAYEFSILDPTTGDPESVTYPENITLIFKLLMDGSNVTSGVGINNITIGGVQADVIEGAGGEVFEYYDDFETDFGHWATHQGINCPDADAWGDRGTTTPSSGTGPQSGGVGGAGTYFIFVETSSGNCYDTGDIALVYFNTTLNYDTSDSEKIEFYFDAYGATIDDLYLEENSTGSWVKLWEMHDINSDVWNFTSVDLSSLTGSGTLRFNYTRTSTGYTSDIALDRINITGGGSGDEFAWVEGSGWNVNVSIPDFASGSKDLFVNISYDSNNFNDTETEAVVYGAAPPAWMDWSQNQTNSTVAGENILFSVFWNSSSNLSSYIFGWWNGANWTQTNYSGDKESGEQTFSGEGGGGGEDYTEQNCSGYWGFDCGVTCNIPEGDNTHDACASCIGGAADEHVDQVVINGTVFAQNDAVNITCTFDPYSASTELYMWVKYPNGTWVDIGPGDLAPPDGNIISYSRTFTNTANEGQYWARCIADWDGTGASCESGNYIDHDDLPFNVTAGGGGGDDVDANKTAVEYLNVFSGNVYEQIDNLTIISYVYYYNTSGSVNNGNANATLWLEVYNGSDWIDEGDFSVTGTGNFSKVITTTSILAAWQTDANRDIKISARLMDYNSSSLYDTINWTGVWIDIFSEGDFLKNDSAVAFTDAMCSTPKKECWSNMTKEITSSVGATIKWQVWANDTGSQTNITDIFQFTTTSGAPDTCTCPGAGNNWEVDMEDMCTLSTPCNLGTGNLSWIGSSGSFTCNAQLNLTNRAAPISSTIFYWSSGCEVNRLIILLLLTSATVFKRKRRLNLT